MFVRCYPWVQLGRGAHDVPVKNKSNLLTMSWVTVMKRNSTQLKANCRYLFNPLLGFLSVMNHYLQMITSPCLRDGWWYGDEKFWSLSGASGGNQTRGRASWGFLWCDCVRCQQGRNAGLVLPSEWNGRKMKISKSPNAGRRTSCIRYTHSPLLIKRINMLPSEFLTWKISMKLGLATPLSV